MDSDNQKAFYCEDDGDYRLECELCDNLYIERFNKNHPKSQIILKDFKKENNSNNLILINMSYY